MYETNEKQKGEEKESGRAREWEWNWEIVERHTETKMRNLQTNTYIHQLTHDHIRDYARLSNVFVENKIKWRRIYYWILRSVNADLHKSIDNFLFLFHFIILEMLSPIQCSKSSIKPFGQFVARIFVNVLTIWSSLYWDHLTNRIYQRHLNIYFRMTQHSQVRNIPLHKIQILSLIKPR